MKTLTTFLKQIGYADKTIQLIDVGARWGTNPPWDKMDASFVKYLGFEPDPKEFAKLQLRNNENIEYLPLGLADAVSDYTLNITHAAGCSSIYEPNNEFMSRFYLAKLWDVEKKVAIKTVPLSQVLDEKKMTPDVLKIDVQGAALKVLQGTGKHLNDVLFVEVEVEFSEIYHNEPLFSEVDKYMRDHGFELLDLNKYFAKHKALAAGYASRGQVLFADAFYIKRPKIFFEFAISAEEKKKRLWNIIAILSVYGHFDYALEYAFHKDSLFSDEEKEKIKKGIENFTSISKWKLVLLNNNTVEKIGYFLSVVANSLQVKSRVYGWGSDNSAVDWRYKYFFKNRLLNIFRK